MFTNILVPLDGSALSEQALPMAQHLARSSDTSLHLLQVISLRPELEAQRQERVRDRAGDGTGRRASLKPRRPGKAYLEGLAGSSSAGLHVTTALREGAADEHISAYAQEQAIDLIVMSTHGHSGFKRFFLGSVTDRVIRAGQTPVLVVPASVALASRPPPPHRRALKTGGPPWPASIPWILKIDTCARRHVSTEVTRFSQLILWLKKYTK